MAQAKQGDTVKVHYTGTLKDGTVFDSSDGREPLEFTIGEGRVIPGFENAVIGMQPGDTRTETIPVDKAYGPKEEELVLTLDRSNLPQGLTPSVGDRLQVSHEDGTSTIVTVTDASDASVTLDANHPLAGEDLTFEIQLVEIAA